MTGSLTGTVLVTYGDVPLLQTSTLTALATEHAASGNAVTVLTAVVADPTGYGRIIRGDGGDLVGIVEQKDADADQRAISEINSGVYAFDGAVLTDALGRLTDANAAGERYLTDVVGIASGDGRRVGSIQAATRSRPRASTTGFSSPNWPGCSTPGWSARRSSAASPCMTRPLPGSTPM